MPQQIIVTEPVSICDSDKIVLPLSPDLSNTYIAPFAPSPLGVIATLNLRVICRLIPDGTGQIFYRLKLFNLVDYQFTMGDGGEIKYIRQTTNDVELFLPFEIRNLTSIETALIGQMKLFIRDTVPNAPGPFTKTVAIIGK